jgi:cytochrome c2
MRAIAFGLLISYVSTAGAQTLKSVSNADNDLKKHQLVLASRLLSWSTGSEEQIDYVSVGRYANYFGFVKMRVSSAHSLKRSEAGRETLSVLTDVQQKILFDLLEEQETYIKATHSARLEANRYLNDLRDGKHTVDDRDGFIKLAQLYAVNEAALGVFLAEGFASVIRTLTPEQKTQLAEVRKNHTDGNATQVSFNPRALRALSREQKQEAFNLAARLLSWTTGGIEDFAYETIGKPSQHFGFVSMRVDSSHGVKRGVVADEVVASLSEDQHEDLLDAAAADTSHLEAYLNVRQIFLEVLTTLRDSDNSDVEKLEALASEMAGLEAGMSWSQAVAMKQILDSLTDDQQKGLQQLRKKYSPVSSADGEKLFVQCNACHQNSSVAPDLAAVVDRPVASIDYSYSPAMNRFAEDGKVWSREQLSRFLTNPQREVPGTTMSYKGVDDELLLASLIEYLDKR